MMSPQFVTYPLRKLEENCTTYKSLALTHVIKDILSVLTKRRLTLQSQQVDISLIHSAAIDAIDNMISHCGPNHEPATLRSECEDT